MQVARVE
jgi:SNF2 family DNA or RNA helicase